MAVPVIMPRQGQSVESCIITKWNKKKGDRVKAGDVLFTYETDKAAFEEEAKADGTLLEVFFKEGDDVPVLANVCIIGEEGEDVSVFSPEGETGDKAAKAEEKNQDIPGEKYADKAGELHGERHEGGAAGGVEGEAADGRIKISPRARALADKAGVNVSGINGTGPDGRIIERDVLAAREKGLLITPAARDGLPAADAAEEIRGTGLGGRIAARDLQDRVSNVKQPEEGLRTGEVLGAGCREVKLSNIRKVIARAMHQSLSSTAQLTLNSSFDATEILALRKKFKGYNERKAIGEKPPAGNITINDIILYAVSRTLLNHKDLNSHFLDDKMLVFDNVHLGIAVDTDRGLMVPTLFNADRKSLREISEEAKDLAERCKNGKIALDLLKGASFTVTNLGTLGIESFTPVLNPPQTGILGVNSIVYRVKEIDGEYMHYPAMGLSLTFDHRALDGAPAARFLNELRMNLENISILLAG